MNISIIVAAAPNGAIGYQGQMPWHLPEDLKRFKQLTTGHPVIMGRKTWDSLPIRPLPRRRNMVISLSLSKVEGGEVFSTLEQALNACQGEEEVFIMGGASIYEQALPLANRIYLTLVETIPANADTFFALPDPQQWEEIKKEKHEGFSFVEYVSKG